MDFGKVKDISHIDFTLPPDHPATAIRLGLSGRAAGEAGSLRIHVGCPVWQDDAMARKLCPPGTPKPQRLACYARQFNSLELNSTGYGLAPEKAARWAAEVPEKFRFCPKVPMDITHVPSLDGVWGRFAEHCQGVLALGKRLGYFFLQFPEQFGPSRFGELERFLRARKAEVPLALEVRHPGWFRDGAADRLFGLLEEQGITAIIVDTPGRRDALHQRLTTGSAFIRFNGHGGGELDFRRLDEWCGRIRLWMDAGLRELYFFTHMDPPDQTVELGAHLLGGLRRATGLDLRQPRFRDPEDEPSLAL